MSIAILRWSTSIAKHAPCAFACLSIRICGASMWFYISITRMLAIGHLDGRGRLRLSRFLVQEATGNSDRQLFAHPASLLRRAIHSPGRLRSHSCSRVCSEHTGSSRGSSGQFKRLRHCNPGHHVDTRSHWSASATSKRVHA